ncbi:MAG: DUF481 domain-containing protein [Spirochaetes bacterium]|nr:DUF481 domain-containing protein [Spirochaetota bacterium]
MRFVFIILLMTQIAWAREDKRITGTVYWNNKLSFGFTTTGGNSDTLNFNGGLQINRNKLWVDEWTFQSEFRYGTDKERISTEKASASLRYAISLTRSFYNFYRVLISHDYMAKEKIRITPTGGIGYWFFDRPAPVLRMMGEIGGGYSKYYLKDNSEEDDILLQVRGFFEWALSGPFLMGENIYMYPAMGRNRNLIQSKTYLEININDRLSNSYIYEIDYNSNPPEGVKKSDRILIISLEWIF